VTATPHDEGGGPPEGNRPAQEMRLRSSRPQVTRLSRKVLLGLAAAAAIGIGGALFFALKPQHQTAGSELYNTNNRNTPDGLANLPHDYTGLPKPAPQLGPPLPGDLGRPILNAGAPTPGMSTPTPGPTPEEQRVAQEQEAARVSRLFARNRLIMPNGRSIVLERQPGADPEGYAGLEDEVDNHWGMLFKAAILSTLLSVGTEAGTSNNENSLVQAIRQGASQSFNQTGEQVVGRSLNIQPTITIRPGFPVRVLVTHDLVLEPYRG
jgi:type IV secretory pathway VirB10-like protein